tara:strand:+ start:80912 stop:81472 length:561 start_codon:yes stop_codon:yes gene_type:complete
MFSGPLPARVNHRKLATEKRKLEGTLQLRDFSRLTDSLLEPEGEVSATLAFRKARKQASLVVGDASVIVSLTCQNCLAPVDYKLSARLNHVIVNTAEALFDLEEDIDGIVSPEDLISPVDLLEDELILSLPMVARHDNADCKVEDYKAAEEDNQEVSPSGETYKPFAGLAELKDELTGASNGRSKK